MTRSTRQRRNEAQVLCLVLVSACAHPMSAPAGPVVSDNIPRATAPLTINGRLDEADWNQAARRTGPFVDENGAVARPYTEARLLADEKTIYLLLYAADEDIESSDCFAIGSLQLCANGRASHPLVRMAVDRDGTLDDPSDDDEEWIVEAAVPRALLSPPFTIVRCDQPKNGTRRCSSIVVSADRP